MEKKEVKRILDMNDIINKLNHQPKDDKFIVRFDLETEGLRVGVPFSQYISMDYGIAGNDKTVYFDNGDVFQQLFSLRVMERFGILGPGYLRDIEIRQSIPNNEDEPLTAMQIYTLTNNNIGWYESKRYV